MPTETGRIIKRKRVQLPGGSTVDIPVITQITFLDVVNQAQETQFSILNSGTAHRDVHVASIPGDGAATDESGGSGNGSDSDLKVERIDVWRVLDVVSQGQESFIHLDNKTIKEPPDAPPYFTTHEKTHIVKYVNTPDDGNWIKSELIDRFKVLDVVEQAQEAEYFLFNPPDNTGISGLTLGTDDDGKPTVAVDPSLEEISDSSNGVDPPWRTDPFQNIVDCSGNPPEFFYNIVCNAWNFHVETGLDTGIPQDQPNPGNTKPSGVLLDGSYAVSWTLIASGHGQLFTPAGVITGPGPNVTLSKTSFSVDPWTFTELRGWAPPQPLNRMERTAPGDGHTNSGPPLVIDGKTIPFWTSSLTATYTATGAPFISGQTTWDEVVPATSTWWQFTGAPWGVIGGGGPTPSNVIATFTLTIDPSPFTFNDRQYRAVGLPMSIAIDITPFGFPTIGQPGSASDVLIYCVPA